MKMNMFRTSLILCCLFLAFSLPGCKKAASVTTITLSGPSMPVNAPGGNAGQGEAAKADPAAGRNVLLQMPFDQAAKVVMLNIGYAYRLAMASNDKPPKNMEELGVEPKNLKTKRDMQDRDVEVLYGIDNRRLDDPAKYVLAWEKTPDNNNARMVLMADYVTVRYVSNAEFETMKKANQK